MLCELGILLIDFMMKLWDVVVIMSWFWLGSVFVVDELYWFFGIFIDGDLCWIMECYDNFFEFMVLDVMVGKL